MEKKEKSTEKVIEKTVEKVEMETSPAIESLPEKIKKQNVVSRKPIPEHVKAAMEREMKPVTGIFQCLEPRGGSVTFSFRAFPGSIESYTMKDGETYTVPLAVAKHINQHCNYATNKYIMDDKGFPIQTIGKVNHRFTFTSKDFF